MKIIVLRNLVVQLMAEIRSKLHMDTLSPPPSPSPFIFVYILICVDCFFSDASMNADDMAGQSVRLKEEHLRKEEEKVALKY